MQPETRSKNLMKLLGWQGGTIHLACQEIGCDPTDFLYDEYDCLNGQRHPSFTRGYFDAMNGYLDLAEKHGDIQYWLGAVFAEHKENE